jgi:FkbM family methyltransferase
MTLPWSAKLARQVLRWRIRGSTRLTFFLAKRLSELQLLRVSTKSGDVLYLDLRVGTTHSILAGLCPEEAEQEIMRLVIHRGDIVYDIGAHIGLHTTLLSSLVGPKGQVHAFEPNPRVLPALFKTIASLPNAMLHQIALSDTASKTELYVPADDSMASLADWTSVKNEKTPRYSCNQIELDDLIKKTHLPYPDFIKCDVEGAELKVFRGASRTLNCTNAPVIMFEVNNRTAHGFGFKPYAAIDFLRDLTQPRYNLFKIGDTGKLIEYKIGESDQIHDNLLAVPEARLLRVAVFRQ